MLTKPSKNVSNHTSPTLNSTLNADVRAYFNKTTRKVFVNIYFLLIFKTMVNRKYLLKN